jgi:AbrB family looped-hinge helix DNA binding protein
MKKSIEVPELTRVSSKGQIVIPYNIREKFGIRKGSILTISAKNSVIAMKKLDTKMNAEDLKTLKLIEEAWEDMEKGRYKSATPDNFFKELAKWKK